MNADGYVTIGTKLDTKDLESGIRKAETELNSLDKEAKRLTEQKVKIEFDNSKLQETIDKYDAMQNEANELRNKLKEMRDAGFMWMTSYDKTEAKLNSVNSQIQKHENSMLKAGTQIDKNNLKLELINKKLKDNGANQDVVNQKIKQMNSELARTQTVGGIQGAINGIQGKMSGLVSSAIKWGLAVFGVRSAYMFVRNAMSTLTQYDKQLATDVEYMRWALAVSLKPIIEFIIKLAYQLLSILRYIIKLLFNYDIFAKAGAEQFKKAKENTGGVARNLGTATKKAKALNKELNKQLATFDEMNILGDNVKQAEDTGNTGGSTPAVGGSSITMPSYDLSDMIKDNIDWGNIIAKIKEGLGNLKTVIKNKWEEIADNLDKSSNPLAKPLAKWMRETEKNVGEWLEGLGEVWGGLSTIIEEIFGKDEIDWDKIKTGLFNIGKGLGKMLLAGFKEAISLKILLEEWIVNLGYSLATYIREKLVPVIKSALNNISIGWGNLTSGLQTKITEIKAKFIALKNAIGTIFKNIGTAIGNLFKSAFKTIFNKLMSAVESRLNKPIGAINTMIGTINKLLPKSKKMSKLKGIKLPKLATGGIVNMPGKGVPVGTAIAGERGAEGVIPLTDSQQMALLGEAIGKYITINANITNNMNGRVISRELQKVQNDNNFAYNR